ncbi:MAG: MarC family protein [Candidatus Acidiferrales bacterium]|jgi:multiple antibiotic resistance protein
MQSSIRESFEFALLTFTSVFFLVDPFAVIPQFLVITADSELAERRHIAKRAGWTCAFILAGFAVAGSLVFRMFGITLPAFKIAGGIILMQIGMDNLRAKRSTTKETPEEAAEGASKADAGIIPLGIPMLAGPAAISTVMVLIGESTAWWQHLVVYAAIVVSSLVSYWILSGADRVRKYLGETGIRILMRLMGLILVAIAVQFIVNGASDLGVIHLPTK